MPQLPHWDLSNVYPGLESPQFSAAISEMQRQTDALEQFLNATTSTPTADPTADPTDLPATLGESVDRFNALLELARTLYSYIYSFTSTDSRDTVAMKKMSEFDQLQVRIQNLHTQWQAWIGRLGPDLEAAIAANPTAIPNANSTVRDHAFILREIAEQAHYLMSEAEESLAAELSLSGARAWNKLQRTVTSQLSVDFELDGEVQKLPMPALINLRTHPDEAVRHRAYLAENAAWATVREPLAAALNGIKGRANTLNRRRGRSDALHAAIDDARIDRTTLEVMLAAMAASFPTFRRYFHAKAKHLGKTRLAWWDLFAPLGKTDKQYSWEEARTFILDNFSQFAPELATYAARAFDEQWIDAEPRTGKSGGAFCMELPSVQESRILTNFDGSLDGVSTIAHELGHGFHNECIYQAGKTLLQSSLPMTLAETASVMCETIVMQAVLDQAQDPQAELAILETMLNGAGQVIVDIYSRYLFEQEVFERRAQAELSADDFGEIMLRAQRATYGDGLDAQHLQPNMWTWKPHYYIAALSFYNFPYAFGLLFSTGLYAIYQRRGPAFVPDYKRLLAATGEANAADLASSFNIDLRSRHFWDDSLAVIAAQIDRFCALTDAIHT